MTASPGHAKQTVSEKPQPAATIELTVPDIKAMHERASAKWSAYEGDVLSATIAEMDFPLAPPVDEEQIVLVPDGMIGLVGLCRVTAAPGCSPAAGERRPIPLRVANDVRRLVRVGRRRRSAHPVDH